MNAPDLNVQLTKRQAERLSSLTGVPAHDLREGTIAELAERYKLIINPRWWLFERVCGRVVKTDPTTGIDYPVPYATVHIQDNDCSFIGFFPTGSQWSWLYPFWCNREDIGVTTTDACGYFCAWIFRFDIDWILEWRRLRLCFPEIFTRPSIRDILSELVYGEEQSPMPRPPMPDPPPSLLANAGQLYRQVEQRLGASVAQKLVNLETSRTVGGLTTATQQLLDASAYTTPVPPPLTQANIEQFSKQILPEAAAKAKVTINAAHHSRIQPRSFIGPFYRCFDVFVPEWVPIIGVPDITFEVTQDINGNGTQEVIYSEGYFDIRWDATSIPDVTLHASQIANASLTCDAPEVLCDGAEPAIQFTGLMPLNSAYHDNATGYALRPNRPHPSGNIVDLPPPLSYPQSTAPYAGTLNLFGCYRIEGGAYYRILYSLNGSGQVPFRDTWYDARFSGTTFVAPDAVGWYSYLPEESDVYDNLLLSWQTGGEGLYSLTLQIADAAKNPIFTAPTPINIYVDNTAPTALFTGISWQAIGASDHGTLNPYGPDCLVINRPVGHDISLTVTFNAYADHFRSVQLSASGCGIGNTPVLVSGQPTGVTEHWYTGTFDNNYTNTALYTIPSSYEQGAYSLSLYAVTRAFNPSGDSTALATDWIYNPDYIYVYPSIAIAIIDV